MPDLKTALGEAEKFPLQYIETLAEALFKDDSLDWLYETEED